MPRVYTAQVLPDTTLPTTTETVIARLDGISTRDPAERVTLVGRATITAGTGTTAVVLRVRRGTSTTDPQVGENMTHSLAAGSSANLAVAVDDFPGEVANQSYVLTAAQVGATANGTVANAELIAIIGV
jgi:hypothetical protein